MSESTLRTGDLVTIRLTNARVTAHHPDQDRLVVQTVGGQTLHIACPQPGLHITCLTSGATLTAPAQDSGIEPAAVLAPPAVLPSSGRGTTLLVDIGDLPAGWAGHVEPRPITDPALTTQDGGEQHG